MNNLVKILSFLIISLIATNIYFYRLNSENEINAIKYKNNFEAAQDSLTKIELTNGELMHVNRSYILTVEELEKYINIKESYITEIEKKLEGNVLYISKIETDINIKDSIISSFPIKFDTIYQKDTIYQAMYSNFEFNNKWYNISGKINIFNNKIDTQLSELNINLPLSVGLTDDWEIFVSTDNPYVNISNIQGSLLDASKYKNQSKRLQFGIQAGVYCIYSDKIRIGPGVGVGINLRLF